MRQECRERPLEVLAMQGAIGSAAGWRALLNQFSEEEQKEFETVHRAEIADVAGNDVTWFNTEVLIGIGTK